MPYSNDTVVVGVMCPLDAYVLDNRHNDNDQMAQSGLIRSEPFFCKRRLLGGKPPLAPFTST
jgi:hypothetical protein